MRSSGEKTEDPKSKTTQEQTNERKRAANDPGEIEKPQTKKLKPDRVKKRLFATPNKHADDSLPNADVWLSRWNTVTDWPPNINVHENYESCEKLSVPSQKGFSDIKMHHIALLFPSKWLGDVVVERFLNIQCKLANPWMPDENSKAFP